MKIIEPSAHILEDELPQNIYQRIDACASVCYQRPAKPTVEEAEQFCRSMVERGHLTTLEMVVVHLVGRAQDVPVTDYVKFDELGDDLWVMTASIRALVEADKSTELTMFLRENFQLFFGDCVNYGPAYVKGCEPVRFAEPHDIPWQHKHVAARFIINRAVSHELVRHRPCSFLQESQRYCRYEDEVTFIEPLWTARGEWLRNEWLKDMAYDEERYKFRLLHKLTPQEAREKLPNSTKTEVICYASLPQWLHIFSLRCSPAADPEMRRVMIPLREEFKEKYPEAFA